MLAAGVYITALISGLVVDTAADRALYYHKHVCVINVDQVMNRRWTYTDVADLLNSQLAVLPGMYNDAFTTLINQ